MTSMRESLSDSEAARRRGDFGSQDGRVVVVDDAMAFSTLGDPARLALPAMLPRALVICGGASVTKCLRTAPRASARGWWPRSPLASSGDSIGAAAQSCAPLSTGAPLSSATLATLGSPRQTAPATASLGARPLRPLAQCAAMLRPHNTTRSRSVGEMSAALSTLGERGGGVRGDSGQEGGLARGDLCAARARARASAAMSCGRRPRGNNCAMSQASSFGGMANDRQPRERARATRSGTAVPNWRRCGPATVGLPRKYH